jgi:hypothetical protein
MKRAHPLRVIIAAGVIMIGALVFGLFPEPAQTTMAALPPSHTIE